MGLDWVLATPSLKDHKNKKQLKQIVNIMGKIKANTRDRVPHHNFYFALFLVFLV